MTDQSSDGSAWRQSPDPYRKVQDPAIIEVFSRADHPVLTTKEIAEELDNIGLKQTRRRLDDLVDEGVVATRKPSRDRVWWLVAEVEEPITARYPLLRHVRTRSEVLLTVVGAALGLLGAFAVMLFLGLNANGMQPPLVTRQDILVGGLYAIALGMSAFLGGLVAIVVLYFGPRLYERISG